MTYRLDELRPQQPAQPPLLRVLPPRTLVLLIGFVLVLLVASLLAGGLR